MYRIIKLPVTLTICIMLTAAISSQCDGAAGLGRGRQLGKDAKLIENTISNGGTIVHFDKVSRMLEISDSETGPILQNGVVGIKTADSNILSNDRQLSPKVTVDAEVPQLKMELTKDITIKVLVGNNGMVCISADGKPQSRVTFQGYSANDKDAFPVLLRNHASVLVTTLGPAEVLKAHSLFFPEYDLLITANAAGAVQWRWSDGWQLNTSAQAGQNLLLLQIIRHCYRNRRGSMEYYAPLQKRSYWKTAPVVAMTWYGIGRWEGWEAKLGQKKEWLYPQIDWVAEHLLPYAGTLIFQLDDNYAKNDDAYMRDISDYIHSRGMLAGLWLTPFTIAPEKTYKEHPEWFLHDPNGRLNTTFGSFSYGWWGDTYQQFGGTLNAANPQAVKNWYAIWWHKVSETWNFDFFKIDGSPDVADAYSKTLEGGGLDGYRQGLRIMRSIIGPDKFVNACQGPSVKSIGLVQGSRTGHDSGNEGHAIDAIIRWNFLNNIVWWCDPDAAANLYDGATVERARLNAQARVLTGQQFLTDDVWTKVPPEICRVWQLSFPMLDIKPANLYKIDNWDSYDIFDLKIAKPWGKWDVVGLFNYTDKPIQKDLDLSRLSLDAAQVHVYEYWSSSYLGRFNKDVKITRSLKAYEGQVFAIVPADDSRPVLLSTSRHISQGALDVNDLRCVRDGDKWIVSGCSTHLVASDEYEMVFIGGQYRLKNAEALVGPAKIVANDYLIRVRFTPDKSGTANWKLVFEPVNSVP